MARPKSADAVATKARILHAAGEAFAGGGRAGSSIRQIASAADVSLAMIHHYFGSKDGLYQACIEAMYQELAPLRATLVTELISGAPLAQLIERAVRTGFRFAREHQRPARLLFRQLTIAGHLDSEHASQQQIPFLEQTTAALAPRMEKSAAELRLPLQSAVVLVARYGISSAAELAAFVGPAIGAGAGTDKSDPAGIEAIVEEHLVRAAALLLGVTRSPKQASQPSPKQTESP